MFRPCTRSRRLFISRRPSAAVVKNPQSNLIRNRPREETESEAAIMLSAPRWHLFWLMPSAVLRWRKNVISEEIWLGRKEFCWQSNVFSGERAPETPQIKISRTRCVDNKPKRNRNCRSHQKSHICSFNMSTLVDCCHYFACSFYSSHIRDHR